MLAPCELFGVYLIDLNKSALLETLITTQRSPKNSPTSRLSPFSIKQLALLLNLLFWSPVASSLAPPRQSYFNGLRC